jgi:hypothetical protein
MNVINNELVRRVKELSEKHNRDVGEDYARFFIYEGELQYRAARRDKTCSHYANTCEVRKVSQHAYAVWERYVEMKKNG